MAHRQHARRSTLVLALFAVLSMLTACVTTPAEPEDVTWELIAKGEIAALDDNTGVFISGHFTRYGGEIESENIIDYKYAYVLANGGVRQRMVSDLWNELSPNWEYPGSHVVTIHQNVDTEEETPRIEVHRCTPPEATQPLERMACVMPDGGYMGDVSLRVDIFVPPGAVVDTDSLSGPTEQEEEAS